MVLKSRKGDKKTHDHVYVLYGVVGTLVLYLAYRSLTQSPAFFNEPMNSESSKVLPAKVETDPPPKRSVHFPATVKRGEYLYLHAGCALCHGLEGRGNVRNPNYVKEEKSPALNKLAEKMFLYEREDVETVLDVLESGKSLDQVEDLDVPRAAAVIAQYENVRKVILGGNHGGKKDPDGSPPFDMPAWKDKLSEARINDIIAYLLSLYPWEEEEN
jgi:mono/diheme cytochrome c family protein